MSILGRWALAERVALLEDQKSQSSYDVRCRLESDTRHIIDEVPANNALARSTDVMKHLSQIEHFVDVGGGIGVPLSERLNLIERRIADYEDSNQKDLSNNDDSNEYKLPESTSCC